MADRGPDGETQWSTERFQEWLEQTAKNENRTKQEVIHRMMASFWVLTEFEDLLGPESDTARTSHEPDRDGQPTDIDPWALLSDTAPMPEDDTPAADSDSDSTSGPDPELVRGLIEGFATYLDEHGPGHTPPGRAEESNQRPANAQPPTPNHPEATQEPAPTGHQDGRGDLTSRLEDIEDSLADLQRHQAELHDDLADLIDGHLSLADTVDELSGEHEALADGHDSLDDRVEQDMGKVEQILKRLTTKYRETDADLDQVEATLTSLLEARRTTEEQRERLASLLQTAHTHGIEAGSCEDCDATIRLGMLTTPRCPHCSKQLVDVRPGGWFRSDIIETGETQHPPPRRRAARTQSEPQQHHTTRADRSTQPADDHAEQPPSDDLDATLRPDETDSDESESFEWADE